MNFTVVGSGASAVHFAKTALECGHGVTLFDVGKAPAPSIEPEKSFEELKADLADPTRYFLGEAFESVTLPGSQGEYYGFPPGKKYVFEGVREFRAESRGFAPLFSFARGGLAETWTAGAFPFHPSELTEFPLAPDELTEHYERVAERIGIGGVEDDLAAVIPFHRHLRALPALDEHSSRLLARGRERRETLRRDAGCLLGRSRIAVLTDPHAGRPACTSLGRCLTGCPTGALYTPSATLEECRSFPRFEYRPGYYVRRFGFDADRRVTEIMVTRVAGGASERFLTENLVLAAGALSTSKIVLESWLAKTGESVQLRGLMDNRQILVPFVNPGMIRRAHDPRTYQYHQIAMALLHEEPRRTIHALVTTLKTAMIHPIVQSLPVDLRAAVRIFRDVHAALGLVNVNLPDRRRDDCMLSLDGGGRRGEEGEDGVLRIVYKADPEEGEIMGDALRRVRRALRILGCFVPPGLSHVRPMGASVHYAGTLPMTRDDRPWTATPQGKLRGFQNLWIADGATFPALPAKNLTFTLMANASRIAEAAGHV